MSVKLFPKINYFVIINTLNKKNKLFYLECKELFVCNVIHTLTCQLGEHLLGTNCRYGTHFSAENIVSKCSYIWFYIFIT